MRSLAVSYTHLDVYKRQGVYNEEDGSMNLNPNSLEIRKNCFVEPNFEAVSYTHLDVYKRQQSVNVLHKKTSAYVQASTQSKMMRTMQEHLTEEEHAVYKRGRNAKSVSPAKNQSITDYRRATGFEALLGYLYLKKDYKRLLDLVKLGLESLEEK